MQAVATKCKKWRKHAKDGDDVRRKYVRAKETTKCARNLFDDVQEMVMLNGIRRRGMQHGDAVRDIVCGYNNVHVQGSVV